MRTRWPLAAGLAAGVALDALLGDPRRGHPVAAFGRAAAALEARDYADSRPRGAAHAAACVLAAAAPAALLHRRTRARPPVEVAAVALTVWAVTGARSLHHEAERIMVSLAGDDIRAAREALPSLCGRDPGGLDAAQITRAVIESVAENTSDAIVAPLLWGAVAGLPGLAAYRAVNTLDAMVGHRSPRYLRFGWASARLDDAALREAIIAICNEFAAYGWRRVRAALRQQGMVANRKRIRRLMRAYGLQPNIRPH